LGIMLNFDRTHPLGCIWGALGIFLGCNLVLVLHPTMGFVAKIIANGVQIVYWKGKMHPTVC